MARPLTVSILAAILWIAMGIALVVGTALCFPGTFLDRMWAYNRPAYAAFHAVGRASGVGFLVLGLALGAAAMGFYRGQRWAWWFSVVIFGLNGVGDLITLLAGRDPLKSLSGFVIAVAFVAALLHKNVSASFNHPPRVL